LGRGKRKEHEDGRKDFNGTTIGSGHRDQDRRGGAHADYRYRAPIASIPRPRFILNGLGYLTLLAALYLPIPRLVPHQRLVRLTLIGYAMLTILAWVAIGERTLLGYSTTADEVALVILLLIEGRRMRLRGEGGL
jgi:hypothetical protein